jgi:hypothetical protein
MKFMTETREEGRIVEMSRAEVAAFRRLVLAVEGKEMAEVYNGGLADEWRMFYDREHPDMSKTFNVIEEWVKQRCNLNEMANAVEIFRKAIGEGDA